MLRPLLLTCAVALLPAAAHADAGVANYALVVGSNAGGPGQVDLHFAEDDARRVGGLLVELGGYARDGVDVVVHPTPDIVRDRLTKLGARVQADVAAGRQARVFFYYSGHARATAIDLGSATLPLDELRQRLFAVPATLTVVVLDACQSGAFSRVKGASPVADFSFNSRQHLDATGIAVLASSSGSELSQESEQLKSSYFTHHLLVGMRGAGDANGDGQVSVDEAYRYAYHQTLLATAETAVGGQHVSLEVDLKGHGEVPLSYPRAATSSIVLPGELEGQALVQDKRAHAVVAETYKAKGAPVRIAVAPGDYEVVVRQNGHLLRCQVTGGGTVELDRCRTEAIATGTRKGGGFERPLRVDVLLSAGGERHDGYLQTLDDFGYYQHGNTGGLAVGALRQVGKQVWVGAMLSSESSPTYQRDTERQPLRFGWNAYSALAVARGEQPFGESRWGAYAQLGAGIAVDRTHYRDQDDVAIDETYVGPAMSVGLGIRRDMRWIDGATWSLGYELVYAPVIANDIGDTHAGGGHRLTLGFSYSY